MGKILQHIPKMSSYWYSFWNFIFCTLIFLSTAKGQEPVFKHYNRINGLKSEYINHIFQDSKGFIWISSDKGLSRYDGKNTLHLNTDNGLPANMVYAIWEEDNKIFFNVYEKGIFAWNGETVKAISQKNNSNKVTYLKQIKNIPIYKYLSPSLKDTTYLNTIVASYLKDYENNEWISIFGKGLFRYIPYLKYYPVGDEIVNLWQDTHNTLFLLGKKGIYVYKNNIQSQVIPLKDARAVDFYQGKFYLASLYNYYEGILPYELFNSKKLISVHCTGFSDILHINDTRWIATFGAGLLKMYKNKVDTISIDNGLVSNNIERLQKTSSALWASTYGNGVSKITFDGKITNFNQEKGLLSNIVYFVFEDTLKKEFWIANEKGITIFDVSNHKKLDIRFQEKVLALHYFKNTYWAVSEKYLYEIKNYKSCKRAGVYLFPPDMWFAINRVFAENEKIYIVGSQGLSVLDLEEVLAQSTSKPHLQILELKTKTKKLDLNPQKPEIILNWQDNFLKISLATLSFLNEQENTIRYRIKEIDTTWTEARPIHEIILSDLSYHKHTLEIQMLDANKNPSDIISFSISVVAPFWHTRWFFAISAVLILALLTGLVRYVSFRKLKNKLKKLELQQKIQEERERIARDLHDNVGSQLTYIITDLEHTSENLANNNLKNKLDEIAQFTRQTINQLRETIWAIHQEKINAENLEMKIRELIWQYTKHFHHIKIYAKIDFQNDFQLDASQALNIYRILQEALNNAFKHSQATEITLYAQASEKYLNIRIEDNGLGFDVGQVVEEGHYGIRNIHKRAEEINAHLNINTSNRGSVISLELKL